MSSSALTTWLRRNGRWKRWTPYFERSLLYIATTDYGRIYTKHGQDYLVTEGEVSKIPYYVSLSLRNIKRVTAVWGPYIFYNGFEATAEAEYVRNMFRYPHLTDKAQKKVTDIYFNYNLWIDTNQEFVEVLNERERRIKDGDKN